MVDEKRKRTRVHVNFQVSVSLHGEWVEVEIENISLTGILCKADDRFRKGEACQVRIRLSPDVIISLDGKILRSDQNQTAISFVSMDEESFFHLKKLLQYNLDNADRIDDELSKPAFG